MKLVELLHCLGYRDRDGAIRLQDVMRYNGTELWGSRFLYRFETFDQRVPLQRIAYRLQYESGIPMDAIRDCLGEGSRFADE